MLYEVPKSNGEHLVSLKGFITLLAALNFRLHLWALSTGTFWHLRTHSHTFINLLSVSAGVRTCQELICTHVAGRIPKLTLELVCFSMSVTSTLCFHSVHLVRCPSAARALANYTLTSSMVSAPSAPFHLTKPHRRKSSGEIISPVSSSLPSKREDFVM